MNKDVIYAKEYYSAIKRWNTAILNNMDEPWVYYAKWKKSDGEKQIPSDLTHVEKNKQTKKKSKNQKPK